jgi:ATPases with chaperone activity, ATP-binding subunit
LKLVGMKDSLKAAVIGQDEAVSKIVKAIQRNRIGLKDPNRPIGSFMFLGPTGVGKTHLAKKIAEQLFDSAMPLFV